MFQTVVKLLRRGGILFLTGEANATKREFTTAHNPPSFLYPCYISHLPPHQTRPHSRLLLQMQSLICTHTACMSPLRASVYGRFDAAGNEELVYYLHPNYITEKRRVAVV